MCRGLFADKRIAANCVNFCHSPALPYLIETNQFLNSCANALLIAVSPSVPNNKSATKFFLESGETIFPVKILSTQCVHCVSTYNDKNVNNKFCL